MLKTGCAVKPGPSAMSRHARFTSDRDQMADVAPSRNEQNGGFMCGRARSWNGR